MTASFSGAAFDLLLAFNQGNRSVEQLTNYKMRASMKVVHHSDRVFTVEALLRPDECQRLIGEAEAKGFAAAGVRTSAGEKALPLIRNNERAIFEAPAWVALLWERLAAIELPVLQGQVAAGLPKDLRFYKYGPGQRFKMHKDGSWKESGMTSQLTLLTYLNEDFEGGETSFRDFIVRPVTGSALVFVHDTWHEGAAVTAGCKYVVRSDIRYR